MCGIVLELRVRYAFGDRIKRTSFDKDLGSLTDQRATRTGLHKEEEKKALP